jgi:DNA-binding transcriptional MerR regulator
MSPEMVERGHLSIGEVLNLLREEFPDVTISKIRFLESQGLLEPERTPSGYRKFYEADVERLRWILRQQREHFLPLKVIRGKLSGEPSAGHERAERIKSGGKGAAAGILGASPADAAGPDDAAAAAVPLGPKAAVPLGGKPAGGSRARPGERPVEAPPSPAGSVSASAARPDAGGPPSEARWAGATGVDLTLQELANACGLSIGRVQELERFGLITGRAVAGTVYYDEEAMLIANLAAAFLGYGVEARHLRLYKNAAEREAGFIEQVVTPLLKQRNPRSRQQAMDTIGELSRLGHDLRAALLRHALQGLTGP